MQRRLWHRGFLVAAVLSVVLAPTGRATHLPGWADEHVAPGLQVLTQVRAGPDLHVHAARVEPAAPVALRVVSAGDAVGGGALEAEGRETTSGLCRRAGAAICVNGDFFRCVTCGQPGGGVVVDGRVLRSFSPGHGQLSLLDGRVTTAELWWEGTLRAVVGAAPPVTLVLDSLNREPTPSGINLYTADWGSHTPPVAGLVEVVVSTGGALAPGVRHAAPVSLRDGSGAIPADGAVIAATGERAIELRRLWDDWHRDPLAGRELLLDTAMSFPATLSVGGHPVLLRAGARLPLDPGDTMVWRRHPRTLAASTADGALLLVTVDGRQRGHSDGITLHEAVDLLVSLGAVDAINLDGGGSTTFVAPCATGPCVRNRPSDGLERPVVNALALVSTASPAVVHATAIAAEVPAPPPAPVLITVPPAAPAPVVDAPPATPIAVAAPPNLEPRPLGIRSSSRHEDPDPGTAQIACAALLLAGVWAGLSRRGGVGPGRLRR